VNVGVEVTCGDGDVGEFVEESVVMVDKPPIHPPNPNVDITMPKSVARLYRLTRCRCTSNTCGAILPNTAVETTTPNMDEHRDG